MFAEDLSPFFDTAGHAVTATVKNAAGVAVGTMPVIFDTPLQEVVALDAGVEQLLPAALCKTADVAALGVKHKFTLTVAGTPYAVVERSDDGSGVTTLRMRK